jgi:C1A family cysteine protease
LKAFNMSSPQHIYNYRFQNVDLRDFIYRPIPKDSPIPSVVDLFALCPPVYDQQSLDSCASNVISAAIYARRKVEGLPELNPSRLWIYYQARKVEGTISEDVGASIRSTIKGAAKAGYCSEELLPYNIEHFADTPPAECVEQASENLVKSYGVVRPKLHDLKSCLVQKFCVSVGITVYSSFKSKKVETSGLVPMPKKKEELLGGLALLIVGYDDEKEVFKVRNSWGPEWGDKGYCYIPYPYMLDPELAGDFWRIALV